MPNTIKAFLFQVAIGDDWWEFVKAAEDRMWLCFDEQEKRCEVYHVKNQQPRNNFKRPEKSPRRVNSMGRADTTVTNVIR